jgi:hypothetical protein
VPEARRIAWGLALPFALFAGPVPAAPPPPDAASATDALDVFGGIALGRGLRFNNPFRLRTQLGDDAESLSLSAPYLDLTAGMAFGRADGVAHGGALVLSIALEGVPQEVLAPSYVALWRLPPRWLLIGRAGLPIVLEPDANLGFELGVGGVFRLAAGVGLCAELVGSLFYGAATPEVSVTTVPLAALELGVWLSYEHLL